MEKEFVANKFGVVDKREFVGMLNDKQVCSHLLKRGKLYTILAHVCITLQDYYTISLPYMKNWEMGKAKEKNGKGIHDKAYWSTIQITWKCNH